MRLNEELDALTTIGDPVHAAADPSQGGCARHLSALGWTYGPAPSRLLGGMVAAHLSLDVGYYYFLDAAAQSRADCELLDRSGQRRGIRGDHRAGRLSLRAAREAQHREPGRGYHQPRLSSRSAACWSPMPCSRVLFVARRHVTVHPAPPAVIRLTGITTRFGQHVVHRESRAVGRCKGKSCASSAAPVRARPRFCARCWDWIGPPRAGSRFWARRFQSSGRRS